MKTLGGIQLPSSILWDDRHAAQGLISVTRVDLAGRPVVWTPRAKSYQIALRADESYGWLPAATVQALAALAATSAGPHILDWEGATYTTYFAGGKSIDVHELLPGSNLFIGSINLVILKE